LGSGRPRFGRVRGRLAPGGDRLPGRLTCPLPKELGKELGDRRLFSPRETVVTDNCDRKDGRFELCELAGSERLW